jgi:hypothetical protein
VRNTVRPSRSVSNIELAVYALLTLAWVVVIDSGSSNGTGYFHQPQVDLLWPLISGSVFNAVTFFVNAFWLIPAYLNRPRYKSYFAGLAGLFGVVIVFKTLADVLIIQLSMPSLANLSFWDLALENIYIFPGFIFFSFVYRFGRDWVTHGREKHLLIEARNEAEQALVKAQNGADTHSDGRARHVLIRSGSSTHKVILENILYLKSEGSYVRVVTKEREILTLMTMRKALALLQPTRFVRVHRSYSVAWDHIDSIEKDAVQIDRTRIPIGRTYQPEFSKLIKSSGEV